MRPIIFYRSLRKKKAITQPVSVISFVPGFECGLVLRTGHRMKQLHARRFDDETSPEGEWQEGDVLLKEGSALISVSTICVLK